MYKHHCDADFWLNILEAMCVLLRNQDLKKKKTTTKRIELIVETNKNRGGGGGFGRVGLGMHVNKNWSACENTANSWGCGPVKGVVDKNWSNCENTLRSGRGGGGGFRVKVNQEVMLL